MSGIKIANYGPSRPGVGLFENVSVKSRTQGSAVEPIVTGSERTQAKPPTQEQKTADTEREQPSLSNTPKEEPKGPSIEERLEAIERRERALIKRQKEWESKRDQPQEEGRMTAQEWREQFLKNPEAVGVGYQDMADVYSNRPDPDADPKITALEKKLAEATSKIEQFEQQQQQKQSEGYKQAKEQISREVGRLVEESQDYATISAANAQNLVVEHIEQVYHAEGVLMSVEEAAKEVEDALFEQAVALAKLDKVKAKLQPEPVQEEVVPQETQSKPKIQSRSQTITNGLLAESKTRKLTKRERAILAFQGIDPDAQD